MSVFIAMLIYSFPSVFLKETNRKFLNSLAIQNVTLNNTESTNLFTSGRLGGLQGGGPNVIGIFCALYSLVCFLKILNYF